MHVYVSITYNHSKQFLSKEEVGQFYSWHLFIGTPTYSYGKLPYLSSESLLCMELISFQNHPQVTARKTHLLIVTAIALLHTDRVYKK